MKHYDLTGRAPRSPFRMLTPAERELNRAALIEAFASILPEHSHDLRAKWTAEAKAHDELAATLKGIVTDYWAKPIPDRRFDWSATDEGYEPGDLIGYGTTEQEAIDDLLKQRAEQ